MAKPIETISIPTGRGAFVNASIWANDIEQDGKKFKTFSVTLEKRYQKEDRWQSASGFNANEMLVVSHVATKAFERCTALRSEANNS